MNIPDKFKVWIEARKRHRLSDKHIQMARELGLNPKKFGKIDNHRQETWKAPLPQFIEHLYEKRFKKISPSEILSIEQICAAEKKKKVVRKLKKKSSQLISEDPSSKTILPAEGLC